MKPQLLNADGLLEAVAGLFTSASDGGVLMAKEGVPAFARPHLFYTTQHGKAKPQQHLDLLLGSTYIPQYRAFYSHRLVEVCLELADGDEISGNGILLFELNKYEKEYEGWQLEDDLYLPWYLKRRDGRYVHSAHATKESLAQLNMELRREYEPMPHDESGCSDATPLHKQAWYLLPELTERAVDEINGRKQDTAP